MIKQTIDDYQRWTGTKVPNDRTEFDQATNMAMGLNESTEIVGEYKKIIFHKHKDERAKKLSEYGDLLFYVSETCMVFDISLSELWLGGGIWGDIVGGSSERLEEVKTNIDPKTNAIIDELSGLSLSSASILYTIRKNPTYFSNHHIESQDDRVMYLQICQNLGTITDCIQVIWHLEGITIAEVIDANIKKLDTRYPNGFNPADSIARVDIRRVATVKEETLDSGLASIVICIGDGEQWIFPYDPNVEGARYWAIQDAMEKAAEMKLDIENLHQILY